MSKQTKSATKARHAKKLSPRTKRATLIIVGVLACALLAYAEVILPNLYAKQYVERMTTSAKHLQDCTDELASTTKTKLFAAPDVSLTQKSQSVQIMKDSIKQCNARLQDFNHEAQSLQELRFSGYTDSYRTAQVIREHNLSIIGQSNDVISQYSQIANFMGTYFDSLEVFVDDTTDIAQAATTNELRNAAQQLGERGNDMHIQAASVRKLKSISGFESIIQPTALMFDNAANGLDNLALGYKLGNDNLLAIGFQDIDQAVTAYDSTVKNLPFKALQDSYAIKQVNGLSVKFNDLKSDSSI